MDLCEPDQCTIIVWIRGEGRLVPRLRLCQLTKNKILVPYLPLGPGDMFLRTPRRPPLFERSHEIRNSSCAIAHQAFQTCQTAIHIEVLPQVEHVLVGFLSLGVL